MKAANTDISSIPNVIYIEPFQVQPGVTNYELSIRMKNSVDIRGFQFDIVLPDGIIPVVEDDVILCDLNEERGPQNSKGKFYHDINATEQDDGSYRILCGSQQEKTFLGTDGEVAVLYVNIASDTPEGDFPVVLKNIKLTETDISKFYTTEMLETTVSVSGTSDTRTILYETSTIAPASATNANVLVKRTINANEWSTLCLPFSMTEEQVKTAFGNDVQLGDFNDYVYDETEDVINVNFVDVTSIDANHPYVIKVSSAISEFTVDGVDIDPQEAIVDFDTSRRKNQPRQMVGVYAAGTVLDWGTLFLNGNKFWYSIGETKMKAFRAYFNFIDVLADFEGNYASRINMSFDNSANGMNAVQIRRELGNNSIYDLQGRVVSESKNPNSLQHGMYIVNGKKVVK